MMLAIFIFLSLAVSTLASPVGVTLTGSGAPERSLQTGIPLFEYSANGAESAPSSPQGQLPESDSGSGSSGPLTQFVVPPLSAQPGSTSGSGAPERSTQTGIPLFVYPAVGAGIEYSMAKARSGSQLLSQTGGGYENAPSSPQGQLPKSDSGSGSSAPPTQFVVPPLSTLPGSTSGSGAPERSTQTGIPLFVYSTVGAESALSNPQRQRSESGSGSGSSGPITQFVFPPLSTLSGSGSGSKTFSSRKHVRGPLIHILPQQAGDTASVNSQRG